MSLNRQILEVAKHCHNMNRAWCIVGDDTTQKKWEDAEQWQRDAAISGVKAHAIGDGETAEESHNIWMQDKLDAGWKWGPVKDSTKLEHPDIVDFSELPYHAQFKDTIFQGCVEHFKSIGYFV